MKTKMTKSRKFLVGTILALTAPFALPTALRAADHGDAPTAAHDQAADIADIYCFLDPSNNANAVIIVTFRGFIVPGEAVNFAVFDPAVRYRIEIENTGDAIPDDFIDVTFNQRTANPGPAGKEILQVPKAQTAKITFSKLGPFNGGKFFAPALNPTLAGTPNTPVGTTPLDKSGNPPKDKNGNPVDIKFFAGEVDDPFFFDIPAFGRFIGSVRNGAPNLAFLDRGRDTFGGYNVLSIAVSIPAALLKGPAGNVVGISCASQRRTIETPTSKGETLGSGPYKNIDREGLPAVNVALVPFNRKNEYNASSPKKDANGKFAGDIVKTLQALGTNAGNLGVLANVAVLHGDILRLDTSLPNAGAGGGALANGFPNGRRLRDDVIDILLSLITNEDPALVLSGVYNVGDNVDSSISQFPLTDTFPFLAPAQQPVASVDPGNPTATDDKTQN